MIDPKEFVGKVCMMILPNGRTFLGILETDGANFGFLPGTPRQVGVPAESIKEVRVIEADERTNMVRAVLVVGRKEKEIVDEAA